MQVFTFANTFEKIKVEYLFYSLNSVYFMYSQIYLIYFVRFCIVYENP